MINEKKHSAYAEAVLRSPEEIKSEKYRLKLKREVGIFYFFDSPSRKDTGLPVNYTSYIEYTKDKYEASTLIDSNQQIPKELYDKLVIARIDLQKRGILPTFNEDLLK